MKLITLNHIVDNCSSNVEGVKFFNALDSAIKDDNKVIIVVDNDSSLSSSFLNTSIGMFVEKYGIEFFKKNIKFQGSKNQFSRISNYLNKFSSVYC